MLTLDSVKISDHFDVLCVLIACMVLEIINQMSKKSKIQSYSVERCTCYEIVLFPDPSEKWDGLGKRLAMNNVVITNGV